MRTATLLLLLAAAAPLAAALSEGADADAWLCAHERNLGELETVAGDLPPVLLYGGHLYAALRPDNDTCQDEPLRDWRAAYPGAGAALYEAYLAPLGAWWPLAAPGDDASGFAVRLDNAELPEGAAPQVVVISIADTNATAVAAAVETALGALSNDTMLVLQGPFLVGDVNETLGDAFVLPDADSDARAAANEWLAEWAAEQPRVSFVDCSGLFIVDDDEVALVNATLMNAEAGAGVLPTPEGYTVLLEQCLVPAIEAAMPREQDDDTPPPAAPPTAAIEPQPPTPAAPLCAGEVTETIDLAGVGAAMAAYVDSGSTAYFVQQAGAGGAQLRVYGGEGSVEADGDQWKVQCSACCEVVLGAATAELSVFANGIGVAGLGGLSLAKLALRTDGQANLNGDAAVTADELELQSNGISTLSLTNPESMVGTLSVPMADGASTIRYEGTITSPPAAIGYQGGAAQVLIPNNAVTVSG